MPSFDRFPTGSTRRTASLALWCAGLAALGAVSPARAEAEVQAPAMSPWSFSGFGTLGVVKQSGGGSWGFVRSSNQVGASSHLSATPDSRVGGQVNWSDGHAWDATLQGVLLNTPSGTPIGDVVQLAYVGYRPTSTTRIRVGRTSPDVFLYADSRNVGFALPWVRPPVDFYGFFPLAAVNGADLEQRWSWDDATWRARATAGTVRSNVTDGAGAGIPLRSKQLVALGLTREDGGLLLKLSYLHARAEADAPAVGALKQALVQLDALPVPGLASTIKGLTDTLWTGGEVSYLGLAAQYETGPWSFVSEGSLLRVPSSPLNARRGYVSVGWRRGVVTYYGLASRVLPDRPATVLPDLLTPLTPVIGASAAAQAQLLAAYTTSAGNGFRFDQATIGAGLRWDFRPSAALKVQVDRFDVHQNGAAGWRNRDDTASHGTLVSVAVDFIVGD